jgi:hypothetical protein
MGSDDGDPFLRFWQELQTATASRSFERWRDQLVAAHDRFDWFNQAVDLQQAYENAWSVVKRSGDERGSFPQVWQGSTLQLVVVGISGSFTVEAAASAGPDDIDLDAATDLWLAVALLLLLPGVILWLTAPWIIDRDARELFNRAGAVQLVLLAPVLREIARRHRPPPSSGSESGL